MNLCSRPTSYDSEHETCSDYGQHRRQRREEKMIRSNCNRNRYARGKHDHWPNRHRLMRSNSPCLDRRINYGKCTRNRDEQPLRFHAQGENSRSHPVLVPGWLVWIQRRIIH